MPLDPLPLLRALHESGVEFVIVGGTAMVVHGSAYLTDDLDIVYARQSGNVRKLIAALREFKPRLRTREGDLDFMFDERTITGGLNFTLATRLGNIDLFGELAGLGDYAAVKRVAQRFEIEGKPYYVLSLRGLVRSKRAAGRQKDLLVIPELEALDELSRNTELPKKSDS